MALAIKYVHNLLHHFSYVSTLPVPDIAQKPKTYLVFVSIVSVALKRASYVSRSQ